MTGHRSDTCYVNVIPLRRNQKLGAGCDTNFVVVEVIVHSCTNLVSVCCYKFVTAH